MEVGAFGSFGKKLGDAPAWVQGPLVGGGRYAVLTAQAVIDTRTGALVPLQPGFIVAYDPVRPRVFLRHGDRGCTDPPPCASYQISVLHLPTGISTPLGTASVFRIPDLPAFFATPEFSYAPGTDELFVRRFSATGSGGAELAVIDATTGALKRTLTDLKSFICCLFRDANWLASADGKRIFALQGRIFLEPRRVVSVDAGSGAVLGETASPASQGGIVEDPVFGRLFHVGTGGHNLHALDQSAQLLGSFPTGYCGAHVKVSPHTGRIYLCAVASS